MIKNVSIFLATAIDQIIGCGQRNGAKYFLVRFKGQNKNEIIDWETAKQYSIEVMEFFGSRAIWTHNIADVIVDDVADAVADPSETTENVNRASTSQLDECPNEIQF